MEPQITASTLIIKVTKFLGSTALERLNAHAKAPTERLIAKRDELAFEAVLDLATLVQRVTERLSEVEREQVRMRFQDDHEPMGILSNYVEDLYREPLDERRRMLTFAAASLSNLALSVAHLARVQRVVRELDPQDLFTLYGLALIPDKKAFWNSDKTRSDLKTQGQARAKYLLTREADALPAAGAVRLDAAARVGGPVLEITSTGWILLKALRPYIRARTPDISDAPWHETTPHFRTESAARDILKGYPWLDALFSEYSTPAFSGRVTYEAVTPYAGSPPGGMTVLKVDGNREPQAQLAPWTRELDKHLGNPVEQIWVRKVSAQSKTGEVTAEICGPHDVLRWLAYDSDAVWV